ncbi:MAG TPA: MMPL family transporter [Solirubrobacterales bacterium]
MEGAVLKLVRLVRRHPRLVLVGWLLAVAISVPFAARGTEHLTGGGFNSPGSQSAEVQERLPEFGTGAELAVVLVPGPDAGTAELDRSLEEVEREVEGFEEIKSEPGLAQARASAAADPSRTVVIPLTVPAGEDDAIDLATELREAFGIGTRAPSDLPPVQIYVAGQGGLWAAAQADVKESAEEGEARGFPAIAIVLLVGFGSLAAMLLPLSLGIVSVALTTALIYALSMLTLTSVFVTNVSTMLGLGVAVDYSLFVLVRYREEIAAGASTEQALLRAMSTSGMAVVFSGLTVVAALAGLFLIDSTALRSIAAGGMIVVVVSVLGAVTLMPALIALLGRRAHEPGRLGKRFRRDRGPGPRFWERWTAAVMRRPLFSVLMASGVLLVLGIPALSMNIENPALDQLSADDPLRTGLAEAAAVAGPGALDPVRVVVSPAGEGGGAVDRRAVRRLRGAIASDPEVAVVAAPRRSADARSVLLSATLRSDPSLAPARESVERLRDRLPAVAGGGATVAVGGATAGLLDFDSLVSGSLWKIVLFILVLSFLVLMVTLRSIVLPLKAVLMTALAVIASYGVIVAIFEWGWLEFAGIEGHGYTDTITPPLVLVIAFGLSMDYEVFLLSRIRERYLATGDTRLSVSEGLASTGRTITTAALIMIVVFLAFVSSGLLSVQRIGVGWAVAVALDATLVRLIVVPAAMVLLDRWNWWLPAWLDRLLPGSSPRIEAALPEPAEQLEGGYEDEQGAKHPLL